jgi:integrase
MTERLSARVIARLKKSAVGREVMATDSKVSSLIVRIHSSGFASYVFRHRERGRVFKTTLGRVGNLTLEDARQTAQAFVGRIALGFDPIAEKAAEKARHDAAIEAARRARAEAASGAVFTVKKMIGKWAAARKDETRSIRYVASIRGALERALEPVLDLPARDLGRKRIEQLVEEAAKRGPAAAAQAQTAIGLAFKRAIKDGWLEINPCAPLEAPKFKPRERELREPEIRRVWCAAGTLSSPASNYVRFLLATGVRRNEALMARWSEIEGDCWLIPAARMKGGRRAFNVPLTRAALRALPGRGAGDYIFSATDGARPIGGLNRVKASLDAAVKADGAGPLAPWTFHDFRRSLATWLSDRGVDYLIADLCLGHTIPLGRTGQTYQRSYKIVERRQALELWGELLDPESAEAPPPALRLVSSSS